MHLKPILTQESDMTKKVIIIVVVLVIAAAVFLNKSQIKNLIQKPAASPTEISNQQQDDSLRVASTKPDPLEGATILPTQSIEITLSKQVGREFKYHFDPEVESQVEELSSKGGLESTYRINFTKPLELGSGYTLYIDSSTHTKDKQNLDHEYIYHFSTISYKGV